MRRALVVAAFITGVTVAAVSRPFTAPADLVVALAIMGMVAVSVAQLVLDPVPPAVARRRRTDRDDHETASSWRPWLLLLVAVVGWELVCFALGPRGAHPTLSSMLDTVTGSDGGRALAFAGWLALGWYLVTR